MKKAKLIPLAIGALKLISDNFLKSVKRIEAEAGFKKDKETTIEHPTHATVYFLSRTGRYGRNFLIPNSTLQYVMKKEVSDNASLYLVNKISIRGL